MEMDHNLINSILREIGFKPIEPIFGLKKWEKQEGNLCFEATVGQCGVAHEGLCVNASFSDGRTIYDSAGLTGTGMSDYFNPPGLLGSEPSKEIVIERMDDIREDVGMTGPKIKEAQVAVRKNDGDIYS